MLVNSSFIRLMLVISDTPMPLTLSSYIPSGQLEDASTPTLNELSFCGHESDPVGSVAGPYFVTPTLVEDDTDRRRYLSVFNRMMAVRTEHGWQASLDRHMGMLVRKIERIRKEVGVC